MILEKEPLTEEEALRMLAEIAEVEDEREPVGKPDASLDELAEFIGYARARRLL